MAGSDALNGRAGLARSGLRRERTGEYRNGRSGDEQQSVDWNEADRLGSNGLEWTVEALRGEERNGRNG